MLSRLPFRVCLLTALLGMASASAEGATRRELERVLEEHNVPLDREDIERRVAKTVLEAVDPEGRILNAEERRELNSRVSIAAVEAWPAGILYCRLRGLFAGGGEDFAARLGEWQAEERVGLIMD